ncbi:MAG: Trm112 family protein [Pseudomonadota bacterium]|nr:Trm112 family protein [Pseudomonadota bacterium]
MDFDKDMLTNLVCPLTGGKLVLSEDKQELLCKLSQLAYPIRDGVPILRYDQARELYSMEVDHDSI